METKKIKLYVEVKKVKLENGKSFNAFKTPIGKLNLDVKFTKDFENVPTKSGYIEVETDKINLNTKKDFPCLWVRGEF